MTKEWDNNDNNNINNFLYKKKMDDYIQGFTPKRLLAGAVEYTDCTSAEW